LLLSRRGEHHNRSPSSILVNKTPHEAWNGNKPSLKHFRVFGCDSYVHIPKENRSKLDNKVEKCIFIGYKYNIKGHKLWDLLTKNIVCSWDVVFGGFKDVPKYEFLQREKELELIEFELNDEEYNSTEQDESREEEEPHNLVLRRLVWERRKPKMYTPHDFHVSCYLSITYDNPIIVREAVDLKDSKLWKKAMVEEIIALDKNESWDLVEFPPGRIHVGGKWVFKRKLNA
jgi:hypothetical protein